MSCVICLILRRLSNGINKFCEVAASILLAVLVVSSSVQVFSRYVLNASQSWTEELARYCFVWATLLGVCIACKKGSLAAVDFLTKSLKGKFRIAQQVLLYLAMFSVAIVFVWQGIKVASIVSTQRSTAMRLPMSYVYSAVPVCGIGLLICFLDGIVEKFGARKGE